MTTQLSDCCKAEINSNNNWEHRHECGKCGRHIGTPLPNHTTDQDVIEEILKSSVEKHFPKGECRERGSAMMLIAEVNIAIKEVLASHRTELAEATNTITEYKKRLEKQTEETFGPRCGVYEEGCTTCEVWKMLDLINNTD
jgi:hypothetical protein